METAIRPIRILMIEDNPADHYLIETLLFSESTLNAELQWASTMKDGLEILGGNTFDIVLLDLILPDAFGLDTIQKLREYNADIPVVVLTGTEDAETGTQAIRMGAQDYLSKGMINAHILQRSIEYSIERRIAENKAHQVDQKYRFLFDEISQGVLYCSSEGMILSANPAALRILKLSEEECLNVNLMNPVLNIVDENGLPFDPKDNPLASASHKREPINDVIIGVSRGEADSITWIKVSALPLFKQVSASPEYIFITFEDITELKINMETINNSLREKEALLKEIHHRVKNNLQIISSLLSLQSEYINDATSRMLFIESMSRIKSMALIHERLYQTQDFTSIHLAGYISDLAVYLHKSYQTGANNVELKIDAEDIYLPIDTAIPCGLILNELITNCFKHAFPDNRQGYIKLHLRRIDKKGIRLSISDNGIGLPSNFSLQNAKTLGVQLVDGLVRQLNGRIDHSSSEGITTFEIVLTELNLN